MFLPSADSANPSLLPSRARARTEYRDHQIFFNSLPAQVAPASPYVRDVIFAREDALPKMCKLREKGTKKTLALLWPT